MKRIKIIAATVATCFILFSGCKDVIDYPVVPDLAEVEPTACTNPPLRLWLFEKFASWGKEPTLIAAGEELQMSNLANFYTLYFDDSSENQYFGVSGEYTDQINKALNDLKRFWDIRSENIITVAAHGSMLRDRNKVIKMYTNIYGYSNDKANKYADSVATLLKTYPQFLNGDHPAFTFNQFAIPDTIIANVGQIPAKIVICDGLLQAFNVLGYGGIAPKAILAHEFGHHIQYDLGIFKNGYETNPKNLPPN